MPSSSRKSGRPKSQRIPSFGESVRTLSRTLSQVPSKIRSNITKTVRRVVDGKNYEFNEPNDLLRYNTITELMFIDPLEINPKILKKGTGELSTKQIFGINLLLHIKEIAERHPPEEREDTIKYLKNVVRQRLDRNSALNREEDEVIKELTRGPKLSNGGNRRTHNRRTRRRM